MPDAGWLAATGGVGSRCLPTESTSKRLSPDSEEDMDESILTQSDYQQLAAVMAATHSDLSVASPADLLIVFSCSDPQVGRAAADLHADGLVRRVIFSGGLGEDSGGLPKLGISEAVFLASIAIANGLPTDVVLLEHEARNGAENAAFSLQLAADLGLLPKGVHIASLAPAQRSRRLYEELRYQADIRYPHVGTVSSLSSGGADPDDPQTRLELVRELRGLSTMHRPPTPRIHRLDEFQPRGTCYDLVEKITVP